MVIIHEGSPIRAVLERADKIVYSDSLAPRHAAIIVEVSSKETTIVEGDIPYLEGAENAEDEGVHCNGAFEGTVLYFPGVTATELLRK